MQIHTIISNMCKYIQYMWIHTHTYTYIHIHTHTYTHINVRMRTLIHTNTSNTGAYMHCDAHMYRYIQFSDAYTYRQIHTHTCKYMHIQDMNTCISSDFHVCLYCACIYKHYTRKYETEIQYEHIWTCTFTDVDIEVINFDISNGDILYRVVHKCK